MKTITLNVTKALIDGAKQKDSTHCMIADALRKKFPQAKSIKVDTQSIRFSDEGLGKRFFFFTPPLAQKRLIQFDQGQVVAPFKFQLLDGIEKPFGNNREVPRRDKHGRKHKRKPGSKRIVPSREREFGLRKLPA